MKTTDDRIKDLEGRVTTLLVRLSPAADRISPEQQKKLDDVGMRRKEAAVAASRWQRIFELAIAGAGAVLEDAIAVEVLREHKDLEQHRAAWVLEEQLKLLDGLLVDLGLVEKVEEAPVDPSTEDAF